MKKINSVLIIPAPFKTTISTMSSQTILFPKINTEVSLIGHGRRQYLSIRNMKKNRDYSEVLAITTGNKHHDQEILNHLFDHGVENGDLLAWARQRLQSN